MVIHLTEEFFACSNNCKTNNLFIAWIETHNLEKRKTYIQTCLFSSTAWKFMKVTELKIKVFNCIYNRPCAAILKTGKQTWCGYKPATTEMYDNAHNFFLFRIVLYKRTIQKITRTRAGLYHQQIKTKHRLRKYGTKKIVTSIPRR